MIACVGQSRGPPTTGEVLRLTAEAFPDVGKAERSEMAKRMPIPPVLMESSGERSKGAPYATSSTGRSSRVSRNSTPSCS